MENARDWTELRLLVGSWEGTGQGEFPTIEPFTFREVLNVTETQPGQSLHYLQRTWKTNLGQDVVSHLETGFINLMTGGQVEIVNAQGSDRAEVLTGIIQPAAVGFTIALRSRSIVNDERMLTSWRDWRLDADTFGYSMGMKTTSVPDGAHHLSAQLRRHDDKGAV